MSFADVGRAGRQRRAAPSSGSSAGAFSAAAAGSGAARSRGGNNAAPSSSTQQPGGGYEQVSDSIVQYQRNVALLEKLARSAGTQNDTSVLQTQYSVQIDVINQLGQRIETQFKAQEQRISSLPRTEAGQLRTTHVKLTRDYRQVEQKFKNVQLDVKNKRSLAEAKQRELATEEEQKERRRREKSGEDMTDEALKWQMQIQVGGNEQCTSIQCFTESNSSSDARRTKSAKKSCANARKKYAIYTKA